MSQDALAVGHKMQMMKKDWKDYILTLCDVWVLKPEMWPTEEWPKKLEPFLQASRKNQNKAQKKKKYVLLFTEFTMIPTLKNCSNFLNLWQDLVIN